MSWLDPVQARKAAAQWARDQLRGEFVIFDSETTGITTTDEFVQLGVVDHTGTVLLDTLVKPVCPITPRAQGIHGLSVVHLVNAPTFPEVYPKLRDTLSGKRVVAYNSDFDSTILEQTCQRYNQTPIEPAEWLCAMLRYAEFHGERRYDSFRWISLTNACANERIPVMESHSAVADCLLTLRLLEKMAAHA